MQEALTIPPDVDDMHEIRLRQKMPKGYVHGDKVIRWYRNLKKSGVSEEELKRYVDDFGNVEDLLKTYDKYIKQLSMMRMLGQKIKFEFNGKQVECDPVKDVDRIRRLEGFIAFVKALGDIVHSDSNALTTSSKYTLDDKDKKLIKLVAYTSKLMVWQTQTYTTTNKFIYHLWQNMKTLGRGDVYGDPSEQTPYCTHSLQHWNDYSGGDTEYTQYWFLRTVDEMTPDATGDLNNIDVMKAFNAMQGKGAKILIAMDDSKCDFLDREDMHVNSSHDNIDSDVRQDVISLRKKLPHFIDAQKIVGDAMQKCVARGEFNIAKFFHMSKKLRLSNMQMYHTADDIFTQLGIKKIVMNDAQYRISSIQLYTIMHQLELRKVPFVEIDIDKLTDDTKHDITDVFSELNMEEFAGMSAPGVKTATRLFWSCESLKKVGDISLPDAYECTCMFRDCTSLTHIGNIYMPKCYICTNMLSGCRNMQHIESMKISCGTAGAYHQFYEEFQLFNVKDALSNQDWLKDTSFDEHTKQLLMSIAHGYVNAKNAHNLQQLHADIVNFNKQLLNGIPTATDIGDSYTYSNGTIKCSSNDRSVLMNLYNWYAQRYKMLPDAEDFVNDDERLALKAYYAQKAPVMPLHIDCVDLTQCSCILRYKKMPFMQDSLFMHIDGKIHDFPSFKITRQQSMYKGTIFSADDIDAVKKDTKHLRAIYGDHGEKVNWIIIGDKTANESLQIMSELHDFMRLFI